jgi:hypothetical protein
MPGQLSTRDRIPILLGLAGTLFVLLLLGGCTAGNTPGRIELSATQADLGTIPNTAPVSRTFEIRNIGGGLLEIIGVSTSCGCTTAEVADRRLPPGGSTSLTVTFDADFHPVQGPVTRLVWLATNDPAQPWVEVRITATVQP